MFYIEIKTENSYKQCIRDSGPFQKNQSSQTEANKVHVNKSEVNT